MPKSNSIIFIIFILFIIMGCTTTTKIESPELKTAVAKYPTPVFYTSDFNSIFGGSDGVSLKFDEYGEIDELEFIAFPGTLFTIEDVIYNDQTCIYKVTTQDYPYPSEKGYFIDSRFVTLSNLKEDERIKALPPEKQILTNLKNAEGAIYTWGGNYCRGIPELMQLYPPKAEIDQALWEQWILCGVDCSGLLYEATNGYIPRNTSSLVSYGLPVLIEGLTAAQIAEKLLPLDIIVWRGHMMVVIDNGNIIESNYDYEPATEGFQGGVRIFPILEKLDMLLRERIPVDNYDKEVEGKKFVIRRWYPD
ncbi:MAG: hypothetical protein JXJ04_13130 [Spirochaetales bacterium]|nr:hypothetical protein [Spirochaetales bacterium]